MISRVRPSKLCGNCMNWVLVKWCALSQVQEFRRYSMLGVRLYGSETLGSVLIISLSLFIVILDSQPLLELMQQQQQICLILWDELDGLFNGTNSQFP
ncbi:hypothetical protein NC652_009484 [Populus alba x Populus x berolinensis]|nr:hypothetical protein NC652_009484 [Populus alba x Populus x berolinensis]